MHYLTKVGGGRGGGAHGHLRTLSAVGLYNALHVVPTVHVFSWYAL